MVTNGTDETDGLSPNNPDQFEVKSFADALTTDFHGFSSPTHSAGLQ